jgi:hypothetical protein
VGLKVRGLASIRHRVLFHVHHLWRLPVACVRCELDIIGFGGQLQQWHWLHRTEILRKRRYRGVHESHAGL